MDVLMPQLGETVAEGKIVKWFVKAGDTVKPGDNLFEIETDKTSMEVPATFGGILSDIHFSVGETAKVGAAVATIAVAGEAPKQAPAGKPVAIPAHTPPVTPAQIGGPALTPFAPAKAGAQGQEAKPELGPRFRGDERVDNATTARDFSYPNMDMYNEVRSPARNYGPAKLASGTFVTPLARRLASERGIDLTRVSGSGPHGRIVAGDIANDRSADTSQGVAQFTLVADVEIGRLLAMRDEAKAGGAEFALGDFAVKAWAAALTRVTPSAGSDIALMQNVGGRRVTTTLRDAAGKSLTAIAREARAATEEAGATTAVYILPASGIREFTAAVTPPFTSVLAIGAPRRAPVEAEDGSVKFISVMTVTLSCNPRAVEDALGAELLAAFKNIVEMPVTALI